MIEQKGYISASIATLPLSFHHRKQYRFNRNKPACRQLQDSKTTSRCVRCGKFTVMVNVTMMVRCEMMFCPLMNPEVLRILSYEPYHHLLRSLSPSIMSISPQYFSIRMSKVTNEMNLVKVCWSIEVHLTDQLV